MTQLRDLLQRLERETASPYGDLHREAAAAIASLLDVVDAAQAMMLLHTYPAGTLDHTPKCAVNEHDHTGSRYDASGKYLGGWIADHECPPCDCGIVALRTALAALNKEAK